MKFFLTNFSKTPIDPFFHDLFFYLSTLSDHKIVTDIKDADVILVGYTHQTDFIFQSYDIGNRPIVIFDYKEFACATYIPFFLCFYPDNDITCNPEYYKLQKFLESKQSQIKIYFKREFYINSPEIPVTIYPIDFIAREPYFWKENVSNIEEFNNRICWISMIWGLSNPTRAILHGEIIKSYNTEMLCTDEIMFEKNSHFGKIAMFYKPCYVRMPFNDMMEIYKQSKIGISLWGSGRKCFRDTEIPFNCVLAIQESNYHYSYPWIHDINCIMLPNKILENGYLQIDEKKSIETINNYLGCSDKLYEIYIAGRNNCMNYRMDTYLANYLIPKLETINEL